MCRCKVATWRIICYGCSLLALLLSENSRGEAAAATTTASSYPYPPRATLSSPSLSPSTQLRRRTRRRASSLSSASSKPFLGGSFPDNIDRDVQMCSSQVNIAKTLLRGAVLRIASDLSGGTVFESIKTRVTTTREGPIEATRGIVKSGGVLALWTGTQSRVIEGALVGAVFMLARTVTKTQVLAVGGSPTTAALAGGLLGGIAQAVVMTPAGMVFTSLNYNRGKPGHANDNVFSVTRRIVKRNGIAGMYSGGGAMALRQATNWASRSYLTEVARTTLGMSQLGVLGEIGSGVIGTNTPSVQE